MFNSKYELMTKKKIKKIAVTGAAGQIGYSLLFRIAAGAMFGEDVKVELRLLELEQAMPALAGIVMELEDSVFPLLERVITTTDATHAFADVDWAILVGSVPRKAGMERKDLLQVNAGLFVKQGKALSESANKACKVLVVGNPCNTNALIARENAKRLNPQAFFAMTMLDQQRAVAQLAKRAQVNPDNVKCMAIWGNHSATQFPDFYHVVIDNKPAIQVINDMDWLKGDFINTVQKRGAEIIKFRGVSSAASAAQAIIESVKCVDTPTANGQFFSIAMTSNGSYKIPEGLIFGFPVRSNGIQCYVAEGIEHEQFAKEMINRTLNELKEERECVKGMIS